MHFKKILASSLTTLLLLMGTASFAQDDNTIYMDEDAFNEALSNAGGSLENLSENFQSFSENVGGVSTENQDPIPVDGGLGLLLAAGLGYGVNRIRKQRNIRKTDIQ